MPFEQFPPVTDCCYVVKNLKLGTLIVAALSVIRGLDIVFVSLVPYCRNFYTETGYLMAMFAAVTAGTGVLVVLSALIMALHVLIYSKPSVDFYILSVFLSVGTTILFFCTAGMKTLTSDYECEGWIFESKLDSKSDNKFDYRSENVTDTKRINYMKAGFVMYMFLDFIVVGSVMIYFALIANQYALETRRQRQRQRVEVL